MALSPPACACDGQDMLTPCRGCPPAPSLSNGSLHSGVTAPRCCSHPLGPWSCREAGGSPGGHVIRRLLQCPVIRAWLLGGACCLVRAAGEAVR